MKIINTERVKGIKAGEFSSDRYFEVSKSDIGWDVEIKVMGMHFRWYPGQRFFFLRKLTVA